MPGAVGVGLAALLLLSSASCTTTGGSGPSTTSTTGVAGGTAARPTPTTSPTTTSTTTPTTTPTTTVAPPGGCTTAAWPVERRAAMTVFAVIGSDRTQVGSALEAGVGGVFVSTAAVPQLADGSLARATASVPLAPMVSIDEEGGRVQRLRDVLGAIPSARQMAAMEPSAVETMARTHALRMRALGLSMDFAPVLDLVEDSDLDGANGIGDRSFGADADRVTAVAGAFARGLAANGILPTYKHFPGHGRATGDSHRVLPTTPPLDQLWAADLKPYVSLLRPGSTAAAVMIGHLDVPGLTDSQPASVSRAAVTDLLRTRIGLTGLVVTDDLGAMRGILDRYDTVDAAVLAVEAGVDMVLVPAAAATPVTVALARAVTEGALDDSQLTASADRVVAAQLAAHPDSPCPSG